MGSGVRKKERESSIYRIRWIPFFNQNLHAFGVIDDLLFKPFRFDNGLHFRLLLPLHLPCSVSLVLLVSIVSMVSMVSMVTVRVWIPISIAMSISLTPRP